VWGVSGEVIVGLVANHCCQGYRQKTKNKTKKNVRKIKGGCDKMSRVLSIKNKLYLFPTIPR